MRIVIKFIRQELANYDIKLRSIDPALLNEFLDFNTAYGARTRAGEFPEALELIATKKVDMLKLLTKTVKLEEVPETIIDIEKNPGSYMKVVVTME